MRVSPQVFLLLNCISLAGCDKFEKPEVPVKVEQSVEQFPVRRFEILQHDADVAFDTQTGQICRTWEWHVGQTALKENTPERNFGETAPTCLSLYITYHPTGEKAPSGFKKF
jgi:hypothetical protein